jgi:hypothetical protein
MLATLYLSINQKNNAGYKWSIYTGGKWSGSLAFAVNGIVAEPFDILVLFELGMKGYTCARMNLLIIILSLWKL